MLVYRSGIWLGGEGLAWRSWTGWEIKGLPEGQGAGVHCEVRWVTA